MITFGEDIIKRFKFMPLKVCSGLWKFAVVTGDCYFCVFSSWQKSQTIC